MGLLEALRLRLRLFRGDPTQRRLLRRSRKPRIGAHVVHVQEELRLVVQAGMSDDLWVWLMDRGWRLETHWPDRRAYRDIPVSYVTRLIDAHPDQRERVMAEATLNAQFRAPLVRGNL